MNAEELEQLVSRYDDPELTEQEQGELEAVLRDDERAQELLRQYKRLDEELVKLPDVTAGIDQGAFTKQIKEAVAASSKKHQIRVKPNRIRFGWQMKLAAMVAVALLAGVAYWSIQPARTTGGAGGEMAGTEEVATEAAATRTGRPAKTGNFAAPSLATSFRPGGSRLRKPDGRTLKPSLRDEEENHVTPNVPTLIDESAEDNLILDFD